MLFWIGLILAAVIVLIAIAKKRCGCCSSKK